MLIYECLTLELRANLYLLHRLHFPQDRLHVSILVWIKLPYQVRSGGLDGLGYFGTYLKIFNSFVASNFNQILHQHSFNLNSTAVPNQKEDFR